MLSLLAGLLWLAQAAQAPPPGPPSPPPPVYVPERVYDTRKQAFTDLESMLADVAKADIVFVGEQHDDPNTHRLEAAILDGLRRRGVTVTLSLEMFERDTQADVDSYLAGKVSEEEFLKTLAALATIRDRLPAARRARQGSGVAGRRLERAAAAGLERRENGPDGARDAHARRPRVGRR